ncbi:MAG: 50S ribosomal protein L24 [Candidatus Methanomethylicia archaeon]|nr:50S ribosomal protein L24 [Candidatus Methanomethylicia archaeon]
MKTTKPKLQRISQSSFAMRAKSMTAHLSKDLRDQYGRRSVGLRKGDTVTVTRGDYKGHEGKVSGIMTSEGRITIEGVTMKKMDGTTKPVMISPSKVMVTKLDLSDKDRKRRLEGKKSKVKDDDEKEKESD